MEMMPSLVEAGITTQAWLDELTGLDALGIGVEMGLEVEANVDMRGAPEI